MIIDNRDPTTNSDVKLMNMVLMLGMIAVVDLLIGWSGDGDVANH
jgi:hypothetical protein